MKCQSEVERHQIKLNHIKLVHIIENIEKITFAYNNTMPIKANIVNCDIACGWMVWCVCVWHGERQSHAINFPLLPQGRVE